MDYIVGNKWIILGALAVIIIILIVVIVGVSVSRKPPVKEEIKSYPAPIVNNLRCGRAEGLWEEDFSVAVFKVSLFIAVVLEANTSNDCVTGIVYGTIRLVNHVI